jgi:predicted  nucleic acid-binding Zn-ribbon protein
MDEDSPTDVSQESRIMVGEIRDSEASASNPNLENTNQETPSTNPNSNEQLSNIPRHQLQEFLNNVLRGIKAGQEESKKQNAALQEEFKKQTALLKAESAKSTAESAKLTSAIESLWSEIKENNDRLANSLTAKFEAAHHKIREDFEAKFSSEIVTVSAKIDNVRKDNESEISKLSSTIDQVYASVTEKVDTAVTQTKEEMAQYVDDKFRAVSGDMRQVRKMLKKFR